MNDYATTHPDGRRDIEAAYRGSLHSQLYLSGPELLPGKRFRLVYEGQATQEFLGRETPYTRIYELVRGATLVGNCAAPQLDLDLALRSNTGRELVYRRRVAPRGSLRQCTHASSG